MINVCKTFEKKNENKKQLNTAVIIEIMIINFNVRN